MLMAILIRGMSEAERTAYALAMMNSGKVLDWSHLDRPTIDKHSTGGVGDKVSLIWAPLMAALGFAVPMISGRGLGHTGGTLDKLEAIPGFRTDLSSDEMDAVLRSVGCVITGQTADLVPADRTLYDLRSRTATVPSIDHIAPSILSKKLAEAAATLVLDVKVGKGAFMKTEADAKRLGEVMLAIGRGAGRNMAALLTDMNSPLGRAVGNGLEVTESVAVLRGGGPDDLRDLTLDLAEAAIDASGVDLGHPAREALETALTDGSAMERFRAMVEAQGGDSAALDDPSLLLGQDGIESFTLQHPGRGWVTGIDALDVGEAVAALGGGRGSDGSAPDPAVGVVLEALIGARVGGDPGDPEGDDEPSGWPAATIYCRDLAAEATSEACERIVAAIRVSDEAPSELPRRVLYRL
jgi:pyrimidine-nucleoside phosphorylase